MKKKKKRSNNNQFKESYLPLVIIAIITIFFILFRVFIKEKKIKELEDLKINIESNKRLNDALKEKIARTNAKIRWVTILLYVLVNVLVYFSLMGNANPPFEKLGHIVNQNSVFFIFVTAFTFARFGSFNSYRKWWSFIETRIEVKIYKNNPDIREIIKNDMIYQKQLEEEIESLS